MIGWARVACSDAKDFATDVGAVGTDVPGADEVFGPYIDLGVWSTEGGVPKPPGDQCGFAGTILEIEVTEAAVDSFSILSPDLVSLVLSVEVPNRDDDWPFPTDWSCQGTEEVNEIETDLTVAKTLRLSGLKPIDGKMDVWMDSMLECSGEGCADPSLNLPCGSMLGGTAVVR